MEGRLYDTLEWAAVRDSVLERDGHRCTVGTLVGGECSGLLHVHHIVAVVDGGEPFDAANCGTACARHHPWWESARREILRGRSWRECTHEHRSAAARRACERRLNRVAAQPDSVV